ncbi:MAG: AAA family ATPase [Chloroflexi bacterium]|nr:AAA family ATPase [Chloroflexota bacterium]
MIKTLEIKNFKSIKHLKLECKRVNVFIGEPNTGKSNILESLGFLSFAYYAKYGYGLKSFVRHERVSNLFYDEELDHILEVQGGGVAASIAFKDGGFAGSINDAAKSHTFAQLEGDMANVRVNPAPAQLSPFKFYGFAVKEVFPKQESGFLLPPFGDNLCSLLLAQKEVRSIAGKIFSSTGFKLGLRPQENRLELRKEVDDVTIFHPYSLTSETLQRLVFYMAAIMSNKDSVLVFEEPEAHAFPYHTKYLAEVIGLDESRNQYFISTHNPYFLEPVLEKTPKDEIGIFITYFKDYETKVKMLTQKEMQKTMDMDVFLNLDRFVKA